MQSENVPLTIRFMPRHVCTYGVAYSTLVLRLTRHSWNVACNTRCLQGSEEVRERVLQCNYCVTKGRRRLYAAGAVELGIQSTSTRLPREISSATCSNAALRIQRDCKFRLLSLVIARDRLARGAIAESRK